jgi:hypothetical protein
LQLASKLQWEVISCGALPIAAAAAQRILEYSLLYFLPLHTIASTHAWSIHSYLQQYSVNLHLHLGMIFFLPEICIHMCRSCLSELASSLTQVLIYEILVVTSWWNISGVCVCM